MLLITNTPLVNTQIKANSPMGCTSSLYVLETSCSFLRSLYKTGETILQRLAVLIRGMLSQSRRTSRLQESLPAGDAYDILGSFVLFLFLVSLK